MTIRPYYKGELAQAYAPNLFAQHVRILTGASP